MAITSIGYDGSVAEQPWAEFAPWVGHEYGVVGIGDWKVTAKPAADRTVIVASGAGYGDGVYDVSDSSVEVALPSPTGTQWYAIYAHRDWGDNATTFIYADALSSGDFAAALAAGQDPGTVTNQPIALVQLVQGQSQPTQVIDCRVWNGPGGAVAASYKVLQYLTRPGTRVTFGDLVYVRAVSAASAVSWKVVREQVALAARRWSAGRPGSSDLYSGTMRHLVTISIADAPAGEYQAVATWVGNASSAIPHDLILTGPGGGSRSVPCHLSGTLTQTFTPSAPFTHAGGSASFSLYGQTNAPQDARVLNPWTRLDVYYLGPVG